jgi:hypothetical protein
VTDRATVLASLRDWALFYAGRAWPVLPLHGIRDGECACGDPSCSSAGKHPLLPHGSKDATTDPQVIRDWFRRWPGANVGVATGGQLVVLDVDGETGHRSLDALDPPLPPNAPCVVTGNGRHYYFHSEEPVPSSVGRLGPGLDVRGVGAHVCAPPSAHLSGTPYRWERTGPLPEWPGAWTRRLLDSRTNSTPERGGGQGARLPVELHEGERNSRLHRFGSLLRRDGLSADELEAALLAVNDSRCRPPLLADEVRKIARSASRYEPADDRHEELWSCGAVPVHTCSTTAQRHPAAQWRTVTAAELSALELPSADWLVPGFVARGKLALLAAAPGALKTWLALLMTRACASGGSFLGEAVGGCHVLYVDEENGPDELKRRYFGKLSGPQDGVIFSSMQRVRLTDPRWAEAVLKRCLEEGVELVVGDSFRRLVVGDESDSRTVNDLYTELVAFKEAGIAVLLLHHTKKRGIGAREGELARGSIDIAGFADVYVEADMLEGGRVALRFEKVRTAKASAPLEVALVETAGGMVDLAYGAVKDVRHERAEERRATVLAFLEEHPGASLTAIASGAGCDRRTVTKMVEELHVAGKLDPLPGPRNTIRVYAAGTAPCS